MTFLTLLLFYRLSENPASGGAAASAIESGTAKSSIVTSTSSPPKYKFVVNSTVRLLNIGIAFMMAFTGALGVGSAKSASDTGNVFVGIYMVLFGAILFTFETVQIRPCGPLDDFYKKNFGFLYGNIGKSLYIFL